MPGGKVEAEAHYYLRDLLIGDINIVDLILMVVEVVLVVLRLLLLLLLLLLLVAAILFYVFRMCENQ